MSPTPKAQRLRDRLSINPDELLPPAPARPGPVAATPDSAAAAPPSSEEVEQPQESPEPELRPAPRKPARPRGRRPQAPAPAHISAVDDPSITAGRKDYRSFYIEDATFARFRAAIYWLARRDDAAGEVPENMSVAVETWMQDTADELERRYNDGEIFRMPPVSRRRRSTS